MPVTVKMAMAPTKTLRETPPHGIPDPLRRLGAAASPTRARSCDAPPGMPNQKRRVFEKLPHYKTLPAFTCCMAPTETALDCILSRRLAAWYLCVVFGPNIFFLLFRRHVPS